MASYADARGAALAVASLRSRGFASDAVAVQPGEMSLAPRLLTRTPRHPDWLAPAAAGTGALVVVLTGRDVTSSAVLAAAGIALVVACVARVSVIVRRRWRDRRDARAARSVAARRFDVVVTEHDDEAEHLLASWWDPDAMPVRTEGRGT